MRPFIAGVLELPTAPRQEAFTDPQSYQTEKPHF